MAPTALLIQQWGVREQVPEVALSSSSRATYQVIHDFDTEPYGGCYMGLKIGDVIEKLAEDDEWGYGRVLSGAEPGIECCNLLNVAQMLP